MADEILKVFRGQKGYWENTIIFNACQRLSYWLMIQQPTIIVKKSSFTSLIHGGDILSSIKTIDTVPPE